MAALPRQVEQDLRELEAYEASLAPTAVVTAEDTPPVVKPPVETPPKKVEPVVAPVVETKPDSVWEQKYRTLEGKYQAEVPRLHQQNKELASQLQTLSATVETLKQPQQTPPQTESLVSAKDVEEYGQDLIDVQRRVAREEMAPLRAELSKRDTVIAELRESQKKTGADVSAMTFEQRLAQSVPGFSEINVSPEWIAFLDEPDPFTGEPRRAFAEYAYNNQNVDSVKKVVDFFKSTQAPGSTTLNPAAERQARQAELERQVTPTRTTASQPVNPAVSTRIYTEAEMVAQFNRVRVLNVGGKYDEASKLEAELSDAYIQGRVRG